MLVPLRSSGSRMNRSCLLMPGDGWSMSKEQSEKSNLDDSAVMESITAQWWSFSAFVPLLTGALWLWLASRSGLPAVLLGAVPGALLLGTGLSSLLWAVESRTLQYMALASALGGVLSVPAIFIIGGRARARVGLSGELFCDRLPGPGTASLSCQRAGARYGSCSSRTGRGQ